MFLPIFFLIYWTFAIENTGFGSLFVIDKDNQSRQGVNVFGKRLMVDQRAKVFNFDIYSGLRKFPSGDSVRLDEAGVFMLDKKPDRHWELVVKGNVLEKQYLRYRETTEFTACNDGSIGIKLKCAGARIVFLHYLDFAEVEY